MRVTEIFQRCGEFSFTLDAPPPDILNELARALGSANDPQAWGARDGAIVVVPSRLITKEEISLDLASYTGILTSREGRYGFRGRGGELFLGTDGVPGPYRIIAPGLFENRTLANSMSFLIFPPYTANVIDEPGAPIDWTFPTATTYAENIDWVTDLFVDTSWRLNPDFTIDVGTTPNVVRTEPQVLIGVIPVGDYGSSVELRSLRGTVTRMLDAEGVTNGATAFGKNFGGGAFDTETKTSARPTTRDPVNGAEQPTTRVVDLPQSAFSAELSDGAAKALAQYEYPRDEYLVACPASADVAQWVKRGDAVYLYDPVGDVMDLNNHVKFRSVDVFPVFATVTELEYPVQETDGIWLLRHDGSDQEWTELTPWVVPDTGEARLTVSAARGALDMATAGPARFHPSLANRLDRETVWRDMTIVDVRQASTSVTFTTNEARYTITDGFLVFRISLTFTSTGQNNQEIILELDPSEWGATDIGDGDQFVYQRSSGVTYTGATVARSSTTLAFTQSSETNGIGRTPNFSIGVGDVLTLQADGPLN